MLIEFEKVMVRLDGRVILSNLNLTLSEGRIGIIGLNGSGKSSLVRLINGLVQPCAGTVRVNGFCARENSRALRRRVGFVFQNPENQLVLPIVGEDLLWGLDAKAFSVDQRQQKVAVALESLGISDLLERSVHTLWLLLGCWFWSQSSSSLMSRQHSWTYACATAWQKLLLSCLNRPLSSVMTFR